MNSKDRLDEFIYEVINTSDDEVDIKECASYKSLVRDLEVLEIFDKYIAVLCNFRGEVLEFDIRFKNLTKQDAKKLKEWLEND